MQWLIDLIIEAIGIPPTFIDRGDPAAWDFVTGAFTLDNTWREFDLSGIVPEGATGVLLVVWFTANAVNKSVQFRKDGNANDINLIAVRSTVALIPNNVDAVCPISADRKLQYKASAVGITALLVAVKGWWL